MRRARLSDVDKIVTILKETKVAERSDLRKRVLSYLERSADTCFVCEGKGGALDGAVLGLFNGFHIFLSHFTVVEPRRGQGVGRSLHEALLARAKAIGAIGIIADSWLSSTPFYERLGYRMPGAVYLVRDVEHSD
ncbi:MAG TPA: GNAT family N-acetyltransferase [Blastocatellia bacterium]